VEGDGLSVEVIKKSEKEESLVIRIVETKGKRSSGQLNFIKKPLKLIETDLLEWTNKKEIICEDYLKLTMRPFEIRTYKVKFN
jgi:alpha-mannosidase